MSTRRRFLRSAVALGGIAAVGIPGGLARALAGDSGPRDPARPAARGPASPPDTAGTPPSAADTLVTPSPAAVAATGKHVLPPLPYAYDALEPHIDAQTVELNYRRHQAAHLRGLNQTEAALEEARLEDDFQNIPALERALAFHGSGYYNHLLFWNNMRPEAEAKLFPGGDLSAQIQRDFKSLNKLQTQFHAAALRLEGDGWGALVYHPGLGRLYTLAIQENQNDLLAGAIPLLVCDMWEHAYYLKYRDKRNDYLMAWWKVVDWADVEARFEAARKLGP